MNGDTKKIIDQMRVKLIEIKKVTSTKISDVEHFLDEEEMRLAKVAQNTPKKSPEEPPIESEIIHAGGPERS